MGGFPAPDVLGVSARWTSKQDHSEGRSRFRLPDPGDNAAHSVGVGRQFNAVAG
jgi:hypothetical protein